jgi:hypothetical protein
MTGDGLNWQFQFIFICKHMNNRTSNIRLPKPKLPDGIAFIAKRNMKDRFFVASQENFFGGWKVKTVLIDTGCSSHMLPILEGDLLKLINMFSYETHGWLVAKSTGVTTTSLTLQIYNRAQKIKVCLCNDMKTDLTSGTVKFEYLRFHL